MKSPSTSKWSGGEQGRTVDFLLGHPDAVRDAVERRFLADPAYLAYVESIETELIESYLDGELTTPERSAFEAKYMARDSELKGKVDLIAQFRKKSKVHRIAPLAGITVIAICLGIGWILESRTNASLRSSLQAPTTVTVAQDPGNTIAELRLNGAVLRDPIASTMPLVRLAGSDVLLRLTVPADYLRRSTHVRILDEGRGVIADLPTRNDGVADVPCSILKTGDYFAVLLRGKEVLGERTMSIRR